MFAVLFLAVTANFAQKTPEKNKNNKKVQLDRDNMNGGHSSGVLVLVAHPNLKDSKANSALAVVAKGVDKVEVVDLYSMKKFNVDEFKGKIKGVNAIVFQFPFYYASAPAKMKEWIDDVFYMFSKESIQGKALLVAVTTGSEESAYRSGGRNMFTVDELLRPYQLTANHSGMVWQTPFVVYGMSTKDADKNLSAACKAYKTTLESLVKSAPSGMRKQPPMKQREMQGSQNKRMNIDSSVRANEQPVKRATSPKK